MPQPVFIHAPQYTFRSAGVRALYRLCGLLNRAGTPAVIAPMHPFDTQPFDAVPIVEPGPRPRVAIYPEVVSGNPLGAEIVVRWALNYPGHLGGGRDYGPYDVILVYADVMRSLTAQITGVSPFMVETLFVPVLDPRFIHAGEREGRSYSCVFVSHGRDLSERYPLDVPGPVLSIEREVNSLHGLGVMLRGCDTLYSYDHGSILLKEAVLSGCKVLVMHEDGVFRDPVDCGCAYNADWGDGFQSRYAAVFDDPGHVEILPRVLDRRFPGWRL